LRRAAPPEAARLDRQQGEVHVVKRKRILFVGHEATRTGAPIVLLHLMRWMRSNSEFDFELLLLQGGDLEPAYGELCRVEVVGRSQAPRDAWDRLLELGNSKRRLRSRRRATAQRRARHIITGGSWDLIYVNTVVVGGLVEALQQTLCPIVFHVHEMAFALEASGGERLRPLFQKANLIITPSEATRDDVLALDPEVGSKTRVVQEFVDLSRPATPAPEALPRIRAELGIDPEDLVVAGVGTADWRKGADLFLQVASKLKREGPRRRVRFLWIGQPPHPDSSWERQIHHDRVRLGLQDELPFVGSVADVSPYYELMDVLALTSREDPCPLVCIEAAARGVPIACFSGSGGTPELFGDAAAVVAPYLDTAAMAQQIDELLEDPERRVAMGERGIEIVRKHCDVDEVAPRIHRMLEELPS
jgi:glycosyltransferase involved in cell wall biosynthesis